MLIWLWAYFSHHTYGVIIQDTVLIRSLMVFITALLISLLFGKISIAWLQKMQIGQVVRDDGPQSHLDKSGTPTMGGVLILFSLTVSTLLWSDWHNPYIWICLLATLFTGALGFVDDYKKLVLKNSKGLSAKAKILGQTVIALAAAYALLNVGKHAVVDIPIAHIPWHMGWGFLIFAWLVMVGSSNSVNLTDGLDGLVIVPVMLVAAGLGAICYYHHPFVPHSKEVLLLCASILGSGLGFLWFNTHPAKVFMGDVGALALGTLLALMAIALRSEIVFAIMGGLFVIEALSVMLQVGSYKLRKKRIFKMAPIHHHFELKGLPETVVTVRFWIVAVLFVIAGLVIAII